MLRIRPGVGLIVGREPGVGVGVGTDYHDSVTLVMTHFRFTTMYDYPY